MQWSLLKNHITKQSNGGNVMQTILDRLENILKNDERLLSEGKLLKNKVIELSFKLDTQIIKLLLSDEKLKEFFFTEVEGVQVFDRRKFQLVVNNKTFLPDSYTVYKNKIGLNDENGNFISEKGEVELVWAYKDCILEGGQTKEDQKRTEVFWNETLAPEQRDRLLDPKVITKARRYSTDGIHDVSEVEEKDNLVIKGNNLLALASLLKKYEGKVKCIYIDPPYNTGNDSFKYNDNFTRSTWLTFMKNRLEIAHKLLHRDGYIFVQCDDYQNGYLRILMDSIFGEENYRNSIYWHRTYAGKTVTKKLPWNTDTILMYSKNESTLLKPTTAELSEKDIKSYNKDDNDGRGKYNTVSLQKTGGPGPETTYDYVDNNGKVWSCPAKGWRMRQSKLKALENDNRLYITDTTIREKYYLSERQDIGKQIDNFWSDLCEYRNDDRENTVVLNRIIELSKRICDDYYTTDAHDIKEKLDNFWSDIGNMNRVSDNTWNIDGQKPEQLIQRVLSLSTSEDDLVLDFFAGSGTTAVVAHKMKRRFIAVEQMDYIETMTIPRLVKTINGDDTGISKSVGWQGGGTFVYLELMKLNEKYIDDIAAATTSDDLMGIWTMMKESAFISYKVDVRTIDEHVSEFEALSVEDKKRFLVEVLDKNMLYVNYCDINDEDYEISQNDKLLNKSFYEGR